MDLINVPETPRPPAEFTDLEEVWDFCERLSKHVSESLTEIVNTVNRAIEEYIYSDNFGSLNELVTAVGSSASTDVLVDDTTVLTSNLTVPANIRIHVSSSGRINQSTYTLTINGLFEAGRQLVFTGSGTVSFGPGAVNEAYPEWWTENTVPGTTDMGSAITAAIASVSTNGTVSFLPLSTYAYATSPNFAVSGLTVRGNNSLLSHTGSAKAFSLDGGAGGSQGPICMRIENLRIKGNSNSPYGVYIRNCHHGVMDNVKVQGCSTSGAGLATEWIVAWEFRKFTVSTNETLSPVPTYGMYLGRSDVGLTTAYNTFIDTIIEGVATGMYLSYADGNVFVGGTSEGNSVYGVDEQSTCTGNTFIKMDFEVNTTKDVILRGRGSKLIDCDTNNSLSLYGSWETVLGGFHEEIVVESGATGCVLDHLEYNRSGGSSTIDDYGTETRIRDCRDALGTNLADQYPNPGLAFAGQAVGASPYTYTNPYKFNLGVIVRAGTVSQIDLVRQSTTTDTGVTAGVFELSPGDAIKVTYSSAPEMVKIARN